MRFLDRLMEGEGGTGGAGGTGTGGAAGGGNGSGTAAGGGTGAPAWYASFPSEVQGYVQNKGFSDPQAVVTAYQNFEKLMGVPKERLVRLPEKDDDAAGWGEVHTKLGRPGKPEEYEVKLPDGVDPTFADFYRKSAHELGLSKKQGDALAKKWAEHVTAESKKINDGQTAASQQQETKLKQEWGAAHDQNIGIAKQAAAAFGLDGDTIDKMQAAMGYDGVMKFMHKIGTKVGEGKFVTGGDGGGNNNFTGALSPQQAQATIAAKMADKGWTQKYLSGDMGAKEEMEKLTRYATAGAH